MNHFGFFSHAGAALLIAGTTSVLVAATAPVLDEPTALKLGVALAGGAYAAFLLAHRDVRVGRIAVSSMWLVGTAALWFMAPSFLAFVALQVFALWLVRTIAMRRGALASVLGLVTTLLATLIGFSTANHTGSFFLATWSFFLVEAFQVGLPAQWPLARKSPRPGTTADEVFLRARQTADNAIARLERGGF